MRRQTFAGWLVHQSPAQDDFVLQINCVIVPIGQQTHQLRGLNSIMVIKPRTVEVSITL